MNDPLHPIWSLIRLSLVLLFLWGVLYFNASSFDETELKVLLYTGAALVLGELGQKQVVRAIDKLKDNEGG
tara:strand:+ start:191 stop:403 length:213 start_codon:yes stop_codon:yes gene_type:complete